MIPKNLFANSEVMKQKFAAMKASNIESFSNCSQPGQIVYHQAKVLPLTNIIMNDLGYVSKDGNDRIVHGLGTKIIRGIYYLHTGGSYLSVYNSSGVNYVVIGGDIMITSLPVGFYELYKGVVYTIFAFLTDQASCFIGNSEYPMVRDCLLKFDSDYGDRSLLTTAIVVVAGFMYTWDIDWTLLDRIVVKDIVSKGEVCVCENLPAPGAVMEFAYEIGAFSEVVEDAIEHGLMPSCTECDRVHVKSMLGDADVKLAVRKIKHVLFDRDSIDFSVFLSNISGNNVFPFDLPLKDFTEFFPFGFLKPELCTVYRGYNVLKVGAFDSGTDAFCDEVFGEVKHVSYMQDYNHRFSDGKYADMIIYFDSGDFSELNLAVRIFGAMGLTRFLLASWQSVKFQDYLYRITNTSPLVVIPDLDVLFRNFVGFDTHFDLYTLGLGRCLYDFVLKIPFDCQYCTNEEPVLLFFKKNPEKHVTLSEMSKAVKLDICEVFAAVLSLVKKGRVDYVRDGPRILVYHKSYLTYGDDGMCFCGEVFCKCDENKMKIEVTDDFEENSSGSGGRHPTSADWEQFRTDIDVLYDEADKMDDQQQREFLGTALYESYRASRGINKYYGNEYHPEMYDPD